MVQIAEPETIEATLSYFADTEAMPVTLVGAPGASDLRTGGGKPDPRQIVLRNGRPYADRFALERDGFRFVHHDTKVADFFDEGEVPDLLPRDGSAGEGRERGVSRRRVRSHSAHRG